jgi:hypothetical protein
MAVGLHLTGRYKPGGAGADPEAWLDRAQAWFETREEEPLMIAWRRENEAGQPTLFVQVHPSGEDVEITVLKPSRIAVSAQTSSLGPGYHLFLCELLKRFGQQQHITWDQRGDDTGYFFSGDEDAVRREMLSWLTALARVIIERQLPEQAEVRMMAMPVGYSYPDVRGVATALGPRCIDWFRGVVADPLRGMDFFPWWHEGLGPAFFLGRGLTRMWQDVRWRTPITDDEARLLMDVHLDLERAWHDDDLLPLPWREWQEIIGYLENYFGYVEFAEGQDRSAEIQRRAADVTADTPLIGYRRRRVQVNLTGGWSLTIPGELAEEWESGGQTWSAWYGGRTVWFSSWSVQGQNGERPAEEILQEIELPEVAERYELREGRVCGRAVFMPRQEEGQAVWNLRAYSAVAGGFALCNVYVQGRDDLPWAIEIWKTLRQ